MLDREFSTLLLALEAAFTLNQQSGLIHLTCAIAPFLMLRGQVAQKQGTYAQAETNFRAALTLARKNNDPGRISAALKDLGRATWKRGNYALAEVYLKEGLALARQIEDPGGNAFARRTRPGPHYWT